MSELFRIKSDIEIFLGTHKCKIANILATNKLKVIEENILKLSSERNYKIVNEHIKTLENFDGQFSQIGMWTLKSRLMPKELDSPMAKFDENGTLITAPNLLQNLGPVCEKITT